MIAAMTDGIVFLELDLGQVTAFLPDTLQMVRLGRESCHLDFDADLKQLAA